MSPSPLLGPAESPLVTADRAARAAHRVAKAHRLTPALTKIHIRHAWREAYAIASHDQAVEACPYPLTGEHGLTFDDVA